MNDLAPTLPQRVLGQLRHLLSSWVAALFLAIAGGLVAMVTPLGPAFDESMQGWRAALHPRSATDRLALIEVDANSLAAYKSWPWPRERYAQAIRALEQQGATMVAFDIDFSATSQPAQDAALASAIETARIPVILPTFRQLANQDGSMVVENLPIAPLRDKAQLAAVNIFADPDGLVRSYPLGMVTQGTPRPAIAAMLADASGAADTTFPLDSSIDPATIAHFSFKDLVDGRIPAGSLTDRHVLIGGTAVELGDRYAVGGRGIMSGPMIHMLAAETMLQGSAPVDRGGVVPLLIAALCMALTLRRARQRWPLIAGAAVLILALPMATEMLKLGSFTTAPALAVMGVFWTVRALQSAFSSARMAQQTDMATGLPNARALLQLLGAARIAKRERTLVALRIDRLGDIANVVGQDETAALVLRVAERMAMTANSPVFRIHDGALGWLVDCGQTDELAQRIDAAAAMLRQRFDVGGRAFELTIAFGSASADGRDALAKAMLAADRALERTARWMPHCVELDEEVAWSLTLASEVDTAMAEGHLWVAYQPKLDIRSRSVCGVEALVRWDHPTRGRQFPDSFIPMLEENGKIADLTLFVLEQAMTDRHIWAERGLDIEVAVNVAAYLPADQAFRDRLETVLARFGDEVGRLTLEVTESASMADPELTVAGLEAIRALGPSLSIDDYGTGQSTLTYLKRLPAREIKIDKSFVLGMEASSSDRAMVRSSVALAHELGFKVVAEGVETGDILDLLDEFGCDVAQGWHVGRPAPARDIPAMAQQAKLATARIAA